MKYHIIYFLCLALCLSSCSLDTDTNNNQQSYKSLWHLVNVAGGISGVDDDFDLETIIWSFNDEDGILTVENNNTDITKADGLDSGTYSYLISVVDSENFIRIDDAEMGQLYFESQNVLVIDENETSTGPAADGFIYTFERELVAD
ncbi:hypothetical protein [Aestuariivivens sediminicola]|uniref:hypothetical protein n=1 Tax=Aestuariivivens sediminicola TaxID=2913560 RepID=UPI001F57C099|nr:hypothetical protein [Aestuariivivens sediminicola]